MIPNSDVSPDLWIRSISHGIWRLVMYVLLILGGLYSLGRLKAVIITLFVAATLAYIMRPMATCLISLRLFKRLHGGNRISRHTLRVVATIYVLIFVFASMWMCVHLTITPFIQQFKRVTSTWGNGRGDDLKIKLEQHVGKARGWYEDHISLEWRNNIETSIKKNQDVGDMKQRVGSWLGLLIPKLGEIFHNIVEIVLLPVLAFYFALDTKKLKYEFVGTLSLRRRREVLRMIREFNRIMHSFVVGQGILCLLAGVVVGVGLGLLRVPYWPTLGLLAGITRAIPIVGPIIGGIPIILLALVSKGYAVALGVLIFFTFLHFTESKFVMPFLIGDRMRLHPVVIIVVLLIGQEFGGLLGMFFAAPVASLLREIIRRYWLKYPTRNGKLRQIGRVA